MNKNTKVLRKVVAAESRKGNRIVEVLTPVKNWHSQPKSTFNTVRVPTAVRGANGVVSDSPRRNMQMAVYINKDESGRKTSLTVHEPITKARPITFTNHGYMEYRQVTL
jgi:hypothetical protein